MEAAVNLASRGYKVTLFEKYGEVGGSMNLADKPDHKERIERLIRTYEAQLSTSAWTCAAAWTARRRWPRSWSRWASSSPAARSR